MQECKHICGNRNISAIEALKESIEIDNPIRHCRIVPEDTDEYRREIGKYIS